MRKLLIICFCIVHIISCNENNASGPDTVDVTGKWNLESMVLDIHGVKVTLTPPAVSGSVSFSNSEFILVLTENNQGEPYTTTETGTYVTSENKITLTLTDKSKLEGTINKNILTIIENVELEEGNFTDITLKFNKEGT